MTIISCPHCKRVVAREDGKRRYDGEFYDGGSLTHVGDSRILTSPTRPPNIKCGGCGKVFAHYQGRVK